MNIHVVKSKLHNVTVTEANLNYVGSITIDEELMEVFERRDISVVPIPDGDRDHAPIVRNRKRLGVSNLPFESVNGGSAVEDEKKVGDNGMGRVSKIEDFGVEEGEGGGEER